MKSTSPIMICLLTVSALGLTACAPVQPWERGNLAKPQMALDPHPLQSALRAHKYGSREAVVAVTKSVNPICTEDPSAMKFSAVTTDRYSHKKVA